MDLREVYYGDTAVFSQVGRFTLVHLDSPTPELVAKREAQFNPESFFFNDCELCLSALAKKHPVILYEKNGMDEFNTPIEEGHIA